MRSRDQFQSSDKPAVIDFESLESRLFMRVEGVDVSLFQGAINWQTLRGNNKEFAFVRSSRTNLALDANFHANMAGAKTAGVITGPYHRALPLGEADGGTYTDPITDARQFYNAAKDYMTEGYLRPVIDAEDGHTLGKATLSKWINDFSVELERLSGVRPIVYASSNYATNFLDTSVAARHDLWMARWNGGNANQVNPQTDQPETAAGYVNPYGSWNEPVGGAPSHHVWDFWQYTSNGDGVALGVSSARLDLDVFNGDLETMKRGFLVGHQWNFKNTPFAVGPGIVTTISAEDYDMGGQGYAFNDRSPTRNVWGAYRNGGVHNGVDLRPIDGTTNDYRISDAFAGEWVEYTIDAARAGEYQLHFRVSQADPDARMSVKVDGMHATSFTVPDTNGFGTFTTTRRSISLSEGRHVLRLSFDQAASNGSVAGVDWVKMSFTAPHTVVSPAADGYVRAGTFASQNFGNDSILNVKRSVTTDLNRQAFLSFDLGSLTTATSARLRLNGRLSNVSSRGVVTNVYSIGNPTWTESGLTWNNKPGATGTLRGAVTVNGMSDKAYEIDLTAFIKSELAAGRKRFTLALRNPSGSDPVTIFGSGESATGPQLMIS